MTTSVLARGIAALAPLILIPVMIDYLGVSVYGIWAAAAAVSGMAAFADLGLGNGLMTRLPAALATGELRRARIYISSSYALLAVVAALGIGATWLGSSSIPWATLLGAQDSGTSEIAPLVAGVCISAFLVNVPLSLVQRVQYAKQQAGESNLWLAGGSVGTIVGVLTATSHGASPLLVVALAVAGPPTASVLQSLWFYGFRDRSLTPRFRHVRPRSALSLLRLGGLFFVLTVIMAFALNVDLLIIARQLGSVAVTEFSVPFRIFAQLGILVGLINVPLWPANAEAFARGDSAWVKSTTAKMTWISACMVLVPATAIIVFGEPIYLHWLGSAIAFSSVLMAGLAGWWLVQGALSPRFMVQNSMGVVGPQLVGWALFLVISIPIKWFLVADAGIAVVPIVSTVVYVLTVLPAALVGYRLAFVRSARRTLDG